MSEKLALAEQKIQFLEQQNKSALQEIVILKSLIQSNIGSDSLKKIDDLHKLAFQPTANLVKEDLRGKLRLDILNKPARRTNRN